MIEIQQFGEITGLKLAAFSTVGTLTGTLLTVMTKACVFVVWVASLT